VDAGLPLIARAGRQDIALEAEQLKRKCTWHAAEPERDPDAIGFRLSVQVAFSGQTLFFEHDPSIANC
jgi:hypothetical protein